MKCPNGMYIDLMIPLKQQLIDFAEQDNNAYFWTVDTNVDTYDNWNAKFKLLLKTQIKYMYGKNLIQEQVKYTHMVA